jgi:hypothetical protein
MEGGLSVADQDEVWLAEEIFLVVQNRRDGSTPKASKVPHERYSLFVEDARKLREELGELKQYFGIYRALLYIKERVD